MYPRSLPSCNQKLPTALKVLTTFVACFSSCVGLARAAEGVGADAAWVTYEAESMKTSGVVLGPKYETFQLETEASGQKCVRLGGAGDFVEFTAKGAANALVLRYNLPDSPDGKGTESQLTVVVNGKPIRTLSLNSYYMWRYGAYPFTNRPADGNPRNFYDEVRVKGVTLQAGDVVRLQKTTGDAIPFVIDFVDLENVAAPLAAPANSLSLKDFGASGQGVADDTAALRACMAEAVKQGKSVWVPEGDYKLTGDIELPSNVTIQGAGMWHTAFVGDKELYKDASRRVRFKLMGSQIKLADFSILGCLNFREDSEPNDALVGAGCSHSSIERIWVEHTKTGAWIYNGNHLKIEGCRFRDLLADGVNLCVGTYNNVVENCSARGTGDDCFAMWPTVSDQGYDEKGQKPGNNVFRRLTGQLPSLANGGALYGGEGNRIEDCLFTDIPTGCGILVSTTFPISDEARKIDNNFSGNTRIERCTLLRCGGYDHVWGWRGSLQVCMDHKSITGITLSHIEILDSISDGLTVVGPGSQKGQGTLSNSRLENITIKNFGIGAPNRHSLWIRNDSEGGLTLAKSKSVEVQNDSVHFTVKQE